MLLLILYIVWSRGRAQAATVDTSGTPGPNLTGSAAQQPSGGASNVPGNLPSSFVSQADPVTQQVQQADTTSAESPQAIAAATPTTATATTPAGIPYVSPHPDTVNGQPVTSTILLGGRAYEQASPGSDAFIPVPLSETGTTSNVHRPGQQL